MSSIMICDVLYHKVTMYCCEDYVLSLIMSKLELPFYVLLLYACIFCETYLGGSHPGRGAK
jgi:hypothetical protein